MTTSEQNTNETNFVIAEALAVVVIVRPTC